MDPMGFSFPTFTIFFPKNQDDPDSCPTGSRFRIGSMFQFPGIRSVPTVEGWALWSEGWAPFADGFFCRVSDGGP